jgi:hypothetical protein
MNPDHSSLVVIRKGSNSALRFPSSKGLLDIEQQSCEITDLSDKRNSDSQLEVLDSILNY